MVMGPRGYKKESSGLVRSWCALAVSAILAMGCASPGPPRAPSLRLPALAENLKARRSGDEVLLSWATPTHTTEGDEIRGSIQATVCRQEAAAPGTVPPASIPCAPVHRQKVSSGSSSAADLLPPGLTSGPARLLAYRIELSNDHDRSAGLSAPAYAVAGLAPPAASLLHLSARREGVVVAWTPSGSSAPMEVHRTSALSGEQPSTSATSISAPRTDRSSEHSRSKRMGKKGVNLDGRTSRGASSPDVLLRNDPVLQTGTSPSFSDTGGVLDRTVRNGETYTYTAQRVEAVTLSGHALRLYGVSSPPASLTFRILIPPHPPGGLVSIPSSRLGLNPSASLPARSSDLSIDLSWEPNAETDLLGYYVFRLERGISPGRAGGSVTAGSGTAGVFTRLNNNPIAATAFHDQKVSSGHIYTYRITAVDEQGNESAPSPEVSEIVP